MLLNRITSAFIAYDVRRERFSLVETGVDMLSGIDFAEKELTATFLGSQTNAPQKAYVMNLRNNRIQVLEDTESQYLPTC
jgi:hypothetical protein